MDKNKKRILIYAGIVLFLLMPILVFNYSRADAGWNTGNSGSSSSSSGSSSSSRGSSSGSSSSSSGSSSSSRDYNYRSSSSSSSSGGSGSDLSFIEVLKMLNLIPFTVGFIMLIIPDTGDSLGDVTGKVYSVLRILEIIAAIILFIIYPLYSITSDELEIVDLLFFAFSMLCIFEVRLLKMFERKIEEESIDDDYRDITLGRLSQFLPGYSLNDLKNEVYKRFVDIQNAWMNFNYEELRSMCTDELFNTFKSQLKVLDLKNGQNIMHDFIKRKLVIYDIGASEGIITVKVFLKVSFYDYVINRKTRAVTDGRKNKKITNNYEMVFVKSVMDPVVTDCPNCHAKVRMVTSAECPYCGSTIVVPPNQLVLSKTTNLRTIY